MIDRDDFDAMDAADRRARAAHGRTCTPENGCECGRAEWLAEWPDEVADAFDRTRERNRRPGVCCAPDMCPTCYDQGGHPDEPCLLDQPDPDRTYDERYERA